MGRWFLAVRKELDCWDTMETRHKRTFRESRGVEMEDGGGLTCITGVTASECHHQYGLLGWILKEVLYLKFKKQRWGKPVSVAPTKCPVFCFGLLCFVLFSSLTTPGRKYSVPFFFRPGEFRVRVIYLSCTFWPAKGWRCLHDLLYR